MPAVRFGGVGKQRGEWGVKRLENVPPFSGEEGSSGRWQRAWEVAATTPGRAFGGGGGGVGWAERGEGERWAMARPKGGGREVGHGWAGNRKWLVKILSNFIWNLDFLQTLEICTRRFRRNFDMGILPKIF
jgi:hypothetical protein